MPDGAVLVLGGVGRDGSVVGQAEWFRPASETFEAAVAAPRARANHTATLLTDGRLLVSGGISETGAPWTEAEVWDPASGVGVSRLTVAGARLV